jgi:hypothetical protein
LAFGGPLALLLVWAGVDTGAGVDGRRLELGGGAELEPDPP